MNAEAGFLSEATRAERIRSMSEAVDRPLEFPEADLDHMVEAARAAHFRKYLAETDEMLTTQLAEKYRGLVPAKRIEAMLSMPTRFEDRETFDRSLAESEGATDSQARVLGYSRFDLEPAHVAMDHLEIPKTIAHERLHQLSDPNAVRELGLPLYEGVTEDLAVEAIGMDSGRSVEKCYSAERAIAHDLREITGDRAVEQAYFVGNTIELRRRLDEQMGPGGLKRLQQQILDLSHNR